jgi:DNA helicase-2/ATP-dependent DNA helicase PcrA
MEQLQDVAKQKGISLFEAADFSSVKSLPFKKLIQELQGETKDLPLPEMVEHVIHRSGLIEHYKNEREGADRVENLEELVNAAVAFVQDETRTEDRSIEAEAEITPLTAFLTHAALEAGEHQAGEGQDALQLMTVHSAKGLEFHAVFMSGLEEGLFPHEQSLNEKDGLEEERRLAYVAITRARQRLYLSFAQTRMLHGQTRYSLASRFLEEIPEGLKKWLTPRFARQPRAMSFESAGRKQLYSNNKDTYFPKKEAATFAKLREDSGFRIGQNVTHPKFGAGVIVDAEGDGGDARVQVNFGRQGVKWLAVAVAKLQAA